MYIHIIQIKGTKNQIEKGDCHEEKQICFIYKIFS